jgi:hypothetical protein
MEINDTTDWGNVSDGCRFFIPLSPALGRKAEGGMMNTSQLAPLSSFKELWRKRDLLRSSWALRSVIPRGSPRGRSFHPCVPFIFREIRVPDLLA